MRPCEGLYFSDAQVLLSLRTGHRDYCYSAIDKKHVLEKIAKTNLSIVWEDRYDKYNKYEYTVFIPAKYRVNGKGPLVKGLCCNRNEIPLEYECKIIEENSCTLIKHAWERIAPREKNG